MSLGVDHRTVGDHSEWRCLKWEAEKGWERIMRPTRSDMQVLSGLDCWQVSLIETTHDNKLDLNEGPFSLIIQRYTFIVNKARLMLLLSIKTLIRCIGVTL